MTCNSQDKTIHGTRFAPDIDHVTAHRATAASDKIVESINCMVAMAADISLAGVGRLTVIDQINKMQAFLDDLELQVSALFERNAAIAGTLGKQSPATDQPAAFHYIDDILELVDECISRNAPEAIAPVVIPASGSNISAKKNGGHGFDHDIQSAFCAAHLNDLEWKNHSRNSGSRSGNIRPGKSHEDESND